MRRLARSALFVALAAFVACGQGEAPTAGTGAVPAAPGQPAVPAPVARETPSAPPPSVALVPTAPSAPAVAPPSGEAWVACATSGDEQCVIRELAPRAGLEWQPQGALIEAYRATANTPAMCGAMREFVSRFADNARSQQYRQVIEDRCSDSAPATRAAEEWVACAAAGDQRCVVRALSARTGLDLRESTALVEAYRAMSDTPHMCAAMREFVSRFPGSPRSMQYRQVIAARCGGVSTPVAPANDEWVACAAQGDYRCVIRVLSTRARLNAREEGMLVEAYRETSDTRRMCATMRDYVTRFPDAPRSAPYRQLLSIRCAGR